MNKLSLWITLISAFVLCSCGAKTNVSHDPLTFEPYPEIILSISVDIYYELELNIYQKLAKRESSSNVAPNSKPINLPPQPPGVCCENDLSEGAPILPPRGVNRLCGGLYLAIFRIFSYQEQLQAFTCI